MYVRYLKIQISFNSAGKGDSAIIREVRNIGRTEKQFLLWCMFWSGSTGQLCLHHHTVRSAV